jgi:hypothetical protein
MKILFLFFVFLPLSSWAFPALHDFVRFEAKYKNDIVIMERSLVEHQTENKSFVQYTRYLLRGNVFKESQHTIPEFWFYTPSKVKNVLRDCEQREGALGSEIIQGKRIETCSFYHEDSGLTYSIGMVPFGQVRHQVYLGDGEFLDFQLVEFKTR